MNKTKTKKKFLYKNKNTDSGKWIIPYKHTANISKMPGKNTRYIHRKGSQA